MASRRSEDRRGDRDRDRDDHTRKLPSKDAKSVPLDEFWLDGEGIDRQVLQSMICRFLGTEATSRPQDLNGRSGFRIRAVRPFTEAMVQDLKTLSSQFRQENSNRPRHQEVPFQDSVTNQSIRGQAGIDSMDYQSSYPSSGPSNYGSYPAHHPQEASSYSYNPLMSQPPMHGHISNSMGSGGIPAYIDSRGGYSGYPPAARDPYSAQPSYGGYPGTYPDSTRQQPPYGAVPGYGEPNRNHPDPYGGYPGGQGLSNVPRSHDPSSISQGHYPPSSYPPTSGPGYQDSTMSGSHLSGHRPTDPYGPAHGGHGQTRRR